MIPEKRQKTKKDTGDYVDINDSIEFAKIVGEEDKDAGNGYVAKKFKIARKNRQQKEETNEKKILNSLNKQVENMPALFNMEDEPDDMSLEEAMGVTVTPKNILTGTNTETAAFGSDFHTAYNGLNNVTGNNGSDSLTQKQSLTGRELYDLDNCNISSRSGSTSPTSNESLLSQEPKISSPRLGTEHRILLGGKGQMSTPGGSLPCQPNFFPPREESSYPTGKKSPFLQGQQMSGPGGSLEEMQSPRGAFVSQPSGFPPRQESSYQTEEESRFSQRQQTSGPGGSFGEMPTSGEVFVSQPNVFPPRLESSYQSEEESRFIQRQQMFRPGGSLSQMPSPGGGFVSQPNVLPLREESSYPTGKKSPFLQGQQMSGPGGSLGQMPSPGGAFVCQPNVLPPSYLTGDDSRFPAEQHTSGQRLIPEEIRLSGDDLQHIAQPGVDPTSMPNVFHQRDESHDRDGSKSPFLELQKISSAGVNQKQMSILKRNLGHVSNPGGTSTSRPNSSHPRNFSRDCRTSALTVDRNSPSCSKEVTSNDIIERGVTKKVELVPGSGILLPKMEKDAIALLSKGDPVKLARKVFNHLYGDSMVEYSAKGTRGKKPVGQDVLSAILVYANGHRRPPYELLDEETLTEVINIRIGTVTRKLKGKKRLNEDENTAPKQKRPLSMNPRAVARRLKTEERKKKRIALKDKNNE